MLKAIGLNHTTAPLELRERIAVSTERVPETLQTLVRSAQLRECVLLSTCNRVEVYAVDSVDPSPELLVGSLSTS